MVGAKEDCSKIKNDKTAAAREDYPVFPGCFLLRANDVLEVTDKKAFPHVASFVLSKYNIPKTRGYDMECMICVNLPSNQEVSS